MPQNGFKCCGKFGTDFDQYTEQRKFMKDNIILVGGRDHCKTFINVLEQAGIIYIAGVFENKRTIAQMYGQFFMTSAYYF